MNDLITAGALAQRFLIANRRKDAAAQLQIIEEAEALRIEGLMITIAAHYIAKAEAEAAE